MIILCFYMLGVDLIATVLKKTKQKKEKFCRSDVSRCFCFTISFAMASKTLLKQHFMFIFQINPRVYFIKSQECFFFNPISFSGLFFAKGNIIKAAD